MYMYFDLYTAAVQNDSADNRNTGPIPETETDTISTKEVIYVS